MSIDATAQALATEEAMPEQVAETPEAETPEGELAAIWDKAQTSDEGDEPEAEPEAEEQAPETADSEADETDDPDADTDEPETPEVEVPTDLPKAIRDAWKDIPEGAREAVLDSQRKMGRQLAEQGRLMQGIAPIRDVLSKATQDLPGLANMRPEQVAQEVMNLAKISNDFSSKPVETIMSLVKQHGLEEPLRQVLAGQAPEQGAMQSNALKQEISQLKRQLQQVSDPEYLRGQVEQYTTQSRVQSEVEQFSQTAEHWGRVEEHMPAAIQFVKASQPDASPQDVLKQAYDLAVGQFVPDAKKATQQPAAQAAPAVDPEKTQAALKAKSVNVRSSSTGKSKPLTEEQELARVYARMQQN